MLPPKAALPPCPGQCSCNAEASRACSTTSCPQRSCGLCTVATLHLQGSYQRSSPLRAPCTKFCKFLPSVRFHHSNATYKHLNVVGRDPRQLSLPTYLRPTLSLTRTLSLGRPQWGPCTMHPRALVEGNGRRRRQVQL